MDHLFLHCDWDWRLWSKLLGAAYLSWVFPAHSSTVLVEDWFGFGKNKKAQTIWRAMCLVILWVIWWQRNQRIFVDKEMSFKDLFEKAKNLASISTSTDAAFKHYPLSLILLSWDDVLR